MSTYDVVVDITSGLHDENLDDLVAAIKQRRDVLASRVRRTLKVGDTVRFNDRTRPQYLIGETATVKHLRPKKVVVALDAGPTGRFGGEIVVPPALLEKVEA